MQRLTIPMVLASIESDLIRRYLARRVLEIQGDQASWEENFAQFLIIEPGDSPESIEKAAAWPLFHSSYSGGPPTFEWIEAYEGLYEIAYVIADSGQFIVVIVPLVPDIDQDLLAFCEQHLSAHR